VEPCFRARASDTVEFGAERGYRRRVLVLVARHSTAVDPYAAPSDDTRWLTSEGRSRMRRVATAIAGETKPTHIFTSPLVRAVQTAEILASGLAHDGPLEVHVPLSVDYGTTAQALAVLDDLPDDAVVALVSHMPKVRILAGHLANEERVPAFRTGSVFCVELSSSRASARFRWMLDPEPLRFSRVL